MQIFSYPSIPYDQAYVLQKHLTQERQNGGIKDTVLMLEHSPTYTMGADRNWDHLLYPREVLEEQGFAIHSCDRGGDITYHGPGQLVVYPIVHLRQAGLTPIAFIRKLEQVIIELLSHYGLTGSRKKGYPGVWLEHAKICAIGIGISKRVTYHGLALNVHTNLRHFENIVPCGLAQFGVTSISREIGEEPDMLDVKKKFISIWEEVLQVKCEISVGSEVTLEGEVSIEGAVSEKPKMTGGIQVGTNSSRAAHAVQR